ncbi:hypothetical protein GC173_00660 [bacterium]|nr:hypothetical protein [bacterium]
MHTNDDTPPSGDIPTTDCGDSCDLGDNYPDVYKILLRVDDCHAVFDERWDALSLAQVPDIEREKTGNQDGSSDLRCRAVSETPAEFQALLDHFAQALLSDVEYWREILGVGRGRIVLMNTVASVHTAYYLPESMSRALIALQVPFRVVVIVDLDGIDANCGPPILDE